MRPLTSTFASLFLLIAGPALAQTTVGAPGVNAAPQAAATPQPAPATPVVEPQPAAPAPQPVAPAATAQPAPERRFTLTTGPVPPPVPRRGRRVHDGFYLRFASGFGAYAETFKSESSEVYAGEVHARTRGLATLGEFAVGGSLRPGLVLGVGVYSAELISGGFRTSRESADVPPPELEPEFRSLGILGPFLDWYPNPQRGFHVQAAVGVAGMGTAFDDFGDSDEEYSAGGAGLVIGIGHEWWIGDQWSLGVLARNTLALVTGEDSAGVRWVHGIATTPSLMMTLTYH